MTLQTLKANKMTIAVVALLIVAFAITLSAMGRIPYCECGLGLWTWSAWSSSTSQLFGDPYSFSHLLHGIIFYGALFLVARRLPLRYRLLIAIIIEMSWEIFENTPFIINRYRAATASLDYFGDSVFNSVGDVIFTMFGFWIAHRLPWWTTLMIVVAIELIMLALMRDNLTLNILMLVYPIQAVKVWQIGQ